MSKSDPKVYFDSLSIGVQIISSEMRYEYLNKQLLKEIDKSENEIFGQAMVDVFPGIDQAPIFKAIKDCLTTGEVRKILNEFTLPDGRITYYSLKLEKVNSSVIIFSEDITEEKNVEILLEKTNSRLEEEVAQKTKEISMFLRGVNDYAIIFLDSEGNITRWNEGAKRIKGYSSDEIIGKHIEVFYTQEDIDRGLPKKELQSAIETGRFEDRGWRLRKDGTRFFANVIVNSIRDDQEQLVGFSKITRDITEQKKQEEELARKNAEIEMLANRFHAVLKTAPDAIFTIDASGIIQNVNDEAIHLFGYTENEMIGKNVNILMGAPYSEEHDSYIKRYLTSGIAKIIGTPRVVEAKKKNGEIFPISLRVAKVETTDGLYFTGIIRDISEAKQKETELAESHKKFRTIFLNSPDAYLIMDLEGGRIVDCNSATEAMLRGRRDQIIGLTPDVLSPELQSDGRPSAELVGERIATILEKGHHRFEWLHKRLDDEVFPCDVNISLIDYEDRKALIVGWRDISDRVNLENELRTQKENAIRHAEFKSQFLARMSHDIRTPLNSIIGMTDVLGDTSLDSNQQSYLKTIVSSGKSLLDLINDVLDLSKIESGELSLNNGEFNLEDLLIGVIDIVSVQARKRDTEIIMTSFPKLNNHIKGDELRFRQILTNLLGNAAKFTKNGTISISAEITHGKSLRINIKDSGIGISEDKLTNIFDSYKQADNSTSKDFGGTGLGLSICKLLTDLMGGKIWVKSSLGSGSTFSVEVPLVLGELLPDSHAYESKLNEKRVLALLHNKEEELYFKSLIEGFGGSLTIAKPQEWSEKISEKEFDCYLVDSEKQSFDVFALLKQKKSLAEKSVLLLPAGKHSKSAVMKAEEIGMSAVQIRPFSGRKLADTLALASTGAKPNDIREDKASSPISQISASILIADDVATNRNLLAAFLRETGCRIVMAKDGREAVDEFKKDHFDLVFMDMFMPILNGVQATSEIRKWEIESGLKRTPILALTANAFDTDSKQMLEAGCDEFLTKPIRKKNFLLKIQEFAANQPSSTHAVSDDKPCTSLDAYLDMETLRDLKESFDEDAYSDFLNKALAGLKELVEALPEIISSEDYQEIATKAHETQGVAVNLSAKQLAEYCNSIGKAAKAKDSSYDYQGSLDKLMDCWRYTEELLRKEISSKQVV